jgi:hypothetical protein
MYNVGPGLVPLKTTEYLEWQLEDMFFAVATRTYSGLGFGSCSIASTNSEHNKRMGKESFIVEMIYLNYELRDVNMGNSRRYCETET